MRMKPFSPSETFEGRKPRSSERTPSFASARPPTLEGHEHRDRVSWGSGSGLPVPGGGPWGCALTWRGLCGVTGDPLSDALVLETRGPSRTF